MQLSCVEYGPTDRYGQHSPGRRYIKWNNFNLQSPFIDVAETNEPSAMPTFLPYAPPQLVDDAKIAITLRAKGIGQQGMMGIGWGGTSMYSAQVNYIHTL